MDIQVRDDDIAEGPEQFFVTLSVSELDTGVIFIQPPTMATVTILNDGDGMSVLHPCNGVSNFSLITY